MPRQGAVTYNAGGEVVSGMVIMRKGANAQDVIARIKARVAVLVPTLPPGVQLVPFYDQTELVGRTTHTIQKNLLLGGALVVAAPVGLPPQHRARASSWPSSSRSRCCGPSS